MDKKQIEYLYELLDLVSEMDIHGTTVTDGEGNIMGIAIGEPEFIEMLDYKWDKNKKVH